MAVAEAIWRSEDAAPSSICTHCALAVPRGLVVSGETRAFCCEGCRFAWQVIHGSGLESYYALSARRGAPVCPTGLGFEEMDHPAFVGLHVTPRADGIHEVRLYLEGIHCASCVWLVERVPLAIPGVQRAEIDVPRSQVTIAWDPAVTSLSAIAHFLDSLGYRPRPFRGHKADVLRRAEDRAMLVRIGVAGAIAVNVMTLALALYSGWFSGMEPLYERYFRWVSLLLTTPALFGPGRVFFRGAWASLRQRVPHMDLPIALALGAGYLRGTINTLADRGPIYFDGVASLVFLLLVGRLLQQRAQRAAADSAELLHSLTPATARIIEDGIAREVPVESLLPGVDLEVRPGETIPADGCVRRGASTVELSLLTGESRPVAVAAGEHVYAGSVNRSAPLVVTVEQAGESSRLGRILRDVESAAGRRAPMVRIADRLASRFVLAVLALAVVTGAIWSARDLGLALDYAIALLIVTCPCALALATPLAVSVAIGRAARCGVLIKGGDALERLARPGLLFINKTGTVTEGRSRLVAWSGPEWVKPLVLALESASTHPIASGFAEAWREIEPREASAVEHTAGGGITGWVAGHRVVVGSLAFVKEWGSGCGAVIDRRGPSHSEGALTPVFVAVDGAVVAHAGFGDRIRPDSRAALDALRARGWRLRLLSGDDPRVVAEVGRALGFGPGETFGAATPEEKRRVIEEAVAREPVVMVGDGVNDAAAIARASVGIGVRGGAEACLAASDVFLTREGLAGLVTLTEGARRCLGLIQLNIAFSLVYNVVGASLAVMGLINPLIAAVMMPLSSLTVVWVSWRGPTFLPPPRDLEPPPAAAVPPVGLLEELPA